MIYFQYYLRLSCFLKAFRDFAIMGATPVNIQDKHQIKTSKMNPQNLLLHTRGDQKIEDVHSNKNYSRNV